MSETHYIVPAHIIRSIYPNWIPETCKPINLPEILEDIKSVDKSCEEGRNGSWDCTTEEGREGFSDMSTILTRVLDEITP
jgi:hypothetical protein